MNETLNITLADKLRDDIFQQLRSMGIDITDVKLIGKVRRININSGPGYVSVWPLPKIHIRFRIPKQDPRRDIIYNKLEEYLHDKEFSVENDDSSDISYSVWTNNNITKLIEYFKDDINVAAELF